MFILDSLLIGSLRFVLDKVIQAAETEAQDDSALRDQLLEAQMRLELGEMSDEEFREIERDVLAAIREIKRPLQGAISMSPGDKITGVDIESFESDHARAAAGPFIAPKARRRAAPSPEPLFIFYGGKGGVGKTTCAAAHGVAE